MLRNVQFLVGAFVAAFQFTIAAHSEPISPTPKTDLTPSTIAETERQFQMQTRALPTDPVFKEQWHLKNTGQFGGKIGSDVNVTPAWDITIGSPPIKVTGKGVTIGIVDDGIDFNHPDLKDRYRPAVSKDFHGNVLDAPSTATASAPCPDTPKWCHGTSIAGIIAGSRNGLGGVGVAPGAALTDLRALYLPEGIIKLDDLQSKLMKHRADVIAIKNNSWGPCDWLGSYSGTTLDLAHFDCPPGPAETGTRMLPVSTGLAMRSALFETTQPITGGRKGLGTVYVWPVGNGGLAKDVWPLPTGPFKQYVGDWGGFDGWSCNRFVIAVGAITNVEKKALYSERSPCVLVSAPGGDKSVGMVTSDLRGKANGLNRGLSSGDAPDRDSYTKAPDLGSSSRNTWGTSLAAPVVSGIVALMLQANPKLSYRDVMHILVQSSAKIDSTKGAWRDNGAGLPVSSNYGFGLVNAYKAVKLAKKWTPVAALASASSTLTSFSLPIPNSSDAGVSIHRILPRIKVEHVEVVVGALHDSPGELMVTLTSPTGMKEVLAVPQAFRQEKDLFYMFTTTHFWDELGEGSWTVTVSDRYLGDSGTFTNGKINIYGTAY